MHFHYLSRPTTRDVVTPRAELEVNLSQLEKKVQLLFKFLVVLLRQAQSSRTWENPMNVSQRSRIQFTSHRREKKIEKSFDGNQKQFFFTSWYE